MHSQLLPLCLLCLPAADSKNAVASISGPLAWTCNAGSGACEYRFNSDVLSALALDCEAAQCLLSGGGGGGKLYYCLVA